MQVAYPTALSGKMVIFWSLVQWLSFFVVIVLLTCNIMFHKWFIIRADGTEQGKLRHTGTLLKNTGCNLPMSGQWLRVEGQSRSLSAVSCPVVMCTCQVGLMGIKKPSFIFLSAILSGFVQCFAHFKPVWFHYSILNVSLLLQNCCAHIISWLWWIEAVIFNVCHLQGIHFLFVLTLWPATLIIYNQANVPCVNWINYCHLLNWVLMVVFCHYTQWRLSCHFVWGFLSFVCISIWNTSFE